MRVVRVLSIGFLLSLVFSFFSFFFALWLYQAQMGRGKYWAPMFLVRVPWIMMLWFFVVVDRRRLTAHISHTPRSQGSMMHEIISGVYPVHSYTL